MKNAHKKGFTLIEMLIVVVIIGILASALLPRLTSVKDKANDVARKANLQQLVTSMSAYALDNGIPNFGGTGDTVNNLTVRGYLTGAGMASIPNDPLATQPINVYGLTTSGYIFMVMRKDSIATGGFVFISRAETAASANYVEGAPNSVAINNATDLKDLVLCDKVNTADTATDKCTGPKNNWRIIVKY